MCSQWCLSSVLHITRSIRPIQGSGVGPTFYIVVNSAGLRSVLLMLQLYANSRNRPRATDENSLLYLGCDFSGGWYNFGKIIKIVSNRCHILELNAPNSVSSAAPPQTPVRKLTALPQI